jgi:anti-sigma B factor antagonist
MSLQLTSTQEDDLVVVRVGGDLDVVTAADLWSHLSALIEDGGLRIVIDCSEVTFLDSSGIATLVRAHRTVTPLGGSVRLREVSRRVLEILTITSLTDVFMDRPTSPAT